MNPNDDPRDIDEARKDDREELAERMREVEEKTRSHKYVKIVEMKKVDEQFERGKRTRDVPKIEYVNVFEIDSLLEFTRRLRKAKDFEWMTEEEFSEEVAGNM